MNFGTVSFVILHKIHPPKEEDMHEYRENPRLTAENPDFP